MQFNTIQYNTIRYDTFGSVGKAAINGTNVSSKDTCENKFGQINCQSVGHALLNKMNESTEENCQLPQQLNRHPISHASLSECIGYNNDELKLKGFSIAHKEFGKKFRSAIYVSKTMPMRCSYY